MSPFWPALRSYLLLAAALCVAAAGFWWLGGLVDFPQYRGFNASLLLQPLAVAKILAVLLGVIVLTAVCTALAGRVRYDAGWGCAVAGLYALRLRGGPVYATLDGRAPGVFLALAAELVLLGLILLGAWAVLHVLRERGVNSPVLRRTLELPDARTRVADRKATSESLDQKLLALVICAATTGACMVALCRTDQRAQVFFSLLISGYVGAWVTHAFIPTRPGAWFWGGPLLCGVVGYVAAWLLTGPQQLAVGHPGGFLAPLARPLPLDYASIAVPAVLYRYVGSRTAQRLAIAEGQRVESAGPLASA